MVRNTSYHSQVRDVPNEEFFWYMHPFDYKRIAFVFPIGKRDFRCRNGLRR